MVLAGPESRAALGSRLVLAPLLALATALSAVACGPQRDPLEPPEISYGEDICDACGMIISEPRFAAATIVRSGPSDEPEPRMFDDIGDMLRYHDEDARLEVLRWYVHDFDSTDWLPAEGAAFVLAPPSELVTPMSSGIAAFADRARAEELAAEVDGAVLEFEALRRRLSRRALPDSPHANPGGDS